MLCATNSLIQSHPPSTVSRLLHLYRAKRSSLHRLSVLATCLLSVFTIGPCQQVRDLTCYVLSSNLSTGKAQQSHKRGRQQQQHVSKLTSRASPSSHSRCNLMCRAHRAGLACSPQKGSMVSRALSSWPICTCRQAWKQRSFWAWGLFLVSDLTRCMHRALEGTPKGVCEVTCRFRTT